MFRPTKGDTVHRIVGRVWATLMLAVAAGSFAFGGWSEPVDWFLRALAAWTLFSVSRGWLLARRGNVAGHRGFMVGTYVGLVIAFVFVVAIPSRQVPQWLAAAPWTMALAAVACMAAAAGVVAISYARVARGAAQITMRADDQVSRM